MHLNMDAPDPRPEKRANEDEDADINDDEDGENGEGRKEQTPTEPLETIGQAYEWLRARAIPKGVAFLTEGGMKTDVVQGEASSGLSGVRRAIYTLLPDSQRRRFFFEMASSKEGLLRLRECFGAPPYAFLHPSDIFALNAGAIGLRRTHLSYEYGSPIPPFGQVGNVLQDDAGNEYALVPNPRKTAEADLLPLVDAIRQGTMPHLVLQISLKQHEFKPDPRKDLELHESTYYWRLRGRPERATLRVKILSTHTSGKRRRTAVLNTRLLSVDTHDIADTKETSQRKERQRERQKESQRDDKAAKQPRLDDDVPPMPEFVPVNT